MNDSRDSIALSMCSPAHMLSMSCSFIAVSVVLFYSLSLPLSIRPFLCTAYHFVSFMCKCHCYHIRNALLKVSLFYVHFFIFN